MREPRRTCARWCAGLCVESFEVGLERRRLGVAVKSAAFQEPQSALVVPSRALVVAGPATDDAEGSEGGEGLDIVPAHRLQFRVRGVCPTGVRGAVAPGCPLGGRSARLAASTHDDATGLETDREVFTVRRRVAAVDLRFWMSAAAGSAYAGGDSA
jgi:hypothetical protein